MIYKLCKKVIKDALDRGDVTEEFEQDMIKKLDVYLLNNRIDIAEYDELVSMMTDK